MMIVKGIVKGKAATALMLVFIVLCLASVTLVRCQPVERDIEIECKWKGAPVGANLKWTEPEEDPVMISNADDGSKSKSGTISSQASTINTQQALMLTGASAGAALAGGGLLVKKKLEGSSEKEISQTASTTTTTSTSSTSSTVPKYTSDSARSYREGLEPHQDELKSSTQSRLSAQTQSNMQNPPKDGAPPTTAKQQYMQNQMNSQSSQQSQSTTQTQRLEQSGVGSQNELTASNLAASAAVVTKELLMKKQMVSITKQSVRSTSAQTGGAQQSTQATASSTSTSQNLGLLASSSSAARMAAEMWPQGQKEFERMAKQRAELAEKFSIPSYCTGLTYPFTNSSGNAWARLQGLGSAIGNGIEKTGVAIKPYTPYIAAAACITILIASMFFTGGATAPTAPTILAGAGVSISIGQGATLVGTGIVVTGLGLYAAHNLGIMNYPRQPSFEAEHTQIIEQSTSELREEKGSGSFGEDVAQEQLDQVEIRKDRLFQPESEDHIEAKYDAELWLQDEMEEEEVYREIKRTIYDSLNKRYFEVQPDLTSKRYIVECKTGRETDFKRIRNQAYEYILLAKQEGKALVYWLYRKPLPGNKEYWDILRQLYNAGVVVLKGPFGRDIFGGG